ncbi:DEAD/DEAH box helicase [Gordonia sp. C13]|uniref:DEAD/DEAH box helicase n=1 Tax=Gordonia sp. C13 TaxID=2935078 RepID=UPI00200A1755|nr:DEAD/DEAH box helicase [Gordonia sp. C13]MCK8615265.1 DEAD/DEAH box helicase [Gordonia sp. C13]
MASVHEVIEAFRRQPTNSERGTKFEELMVRYFQLDPMLSQQYEQVWRWMDWPGRGGKPDTGIDLVARERDSGEYTAIQCKFYEPTSILRKEDIDSFFTASGKAPFTNRVIISTTDRWGRNAEDALENQHIPVQRINLADIAESPIDWEIAWPQGELSVELSEATRHEPRPHQQEAIDAVFAGFGVGHDRGKLIMACGTGKTFTALKIAEKTAIGNGGSARILFAVPSISLLSQTLREWTAQTTLDMRAFAVCSDSKVSRSAEDFGTVDVAIPVTTDPAVLAAHMAHRKRSKGLTVVFTTYQSLPTVAGAQGHGVDPFDLVICDEAHRTTGVTVAGADESNFVKVHDNDFLAADRRLYMTATPRIFDDAVKEKAADHSAELSSMDDVDIYGPEFHRLSFGEAVERGLLTDYKVIVLTVDEELVAAPMQKQLAGDFSELQLDDASKIVGCWNGLAKRAGRSPDGDGFAAGAPPMRRAVAFTKDIAASQQVAEVFPAVVDAYRELLTESENDGEQVDTTNRDLRCEVHHVDGTFNALRRNEQLAWLKAPIPEGECRILTNARCLSEGVDVPALDAVMFLHPRNSVVDVVQSVGRVMRLSQDKDYGYIILPVAVPAGVSPSQALADNRRFKVVWQVLNALRAHDDRFNAMVNSIALNATTQQLKQGKGNNRLLGGHIGPTSDADESVGDGQSTPADTPASNDTGGGMATQMALFSLSEWQEAIYARIVDKVGTRVYWEQWAADVADIASAQIARINVLLDGAAPAVAAQFEKFLTGLRDNLNDSISRDDAISMLSQHLITKPVFDALFAGHDFAAHNPVSIVMQQMVDALGDANLESETASLDKFYHSVQVRASEVSSAEGKQQVIAELYERFFRVAFKKQSDALGIVYTPVEIVDFILRAADHVSREHFGRGLTDQGVHVLDPFTGTGTFLTRLLQSGLILPVDLGRKYREELHANEIMLLAYYIAAVNVETTFHALTTPDGEEGMYEAFEGIVLADTFQITEDGDSMDSIMFPQNNDRIVKQLQAPIHVIVGNPPYSVGQDSANDNNANLRYPTLDGRIGQTYAGRSTGTNKNSLYDSYYRAYRWATDRVGDHGIVAFVSNGGWIDGNTADGVRLSFADEFAHLWVYNLRGNQRTAGELSRREGGKVFGSGSRSTIAIFIGVKDAAHTGPVQIHYRDIGDYLSREEKLRIIETSTIDNVEWQAIEPNAHGDWISHRADEFISWPTLGTKDATGHKVFRSYCRGLSSGRDPWVYSWSRTQLDAQVDEIAVQYREVQTLRDGISTSASSDEVLRQHPELTGTGRISWNRSLRQRLDRGHDLVPDPQSVRRGSYRPFAPQWVYFDVATSDMMYRLPSMFPTPHHRNYGFYAIGVGATADFALLATDVVPDVQMIGAGQNGQFFPRFTYEQNNATAAGELDFGSSADDSEVDEYGYRRIDNITDDILAIYQATLGESVTKDQIFWSVYGQLHVPSYRSTYAADLKKMLPHIPVPDTVERFTKLAQAGEKLGNLHMRYEDVEPYPLDVQLKPGTDPADREAWRVQKMKWRSKTDHSAIIYNPKVTITGIPAGAEEYMLGSRSALAWIIDRYQVKTDKASGIVNDPNLWCDEQDDPTYIIDVIKKVTTISIETMRIVGEL